MSGSQETPPNTSPGAGISTVRLDDVADTITVNTSFSGLTSPATAGHIHLAPIGVAGPILFPFADVPNATSGVIPTQVFAITPTQISALEGGLLYVNIHTTEFPAGEIRGQLFAVPEPATLGLLGLAMAGALSMARRRTRVEA